MTVEEMEVIHNKLIEMMDKTDEIRKDETRKRKEMERHKVGCAATSCIDDSLSVESAVESSSESEYHKDEEGAWHRRYCNNSIVSENLDESSVMSEKSKYRFETKILVNIQCQTFRKRSR